MKSCIAHSLCSRKLNAHGTTAALMKQCLRWQWLHEVLAPGYSLGDQLGKLWKSTKAKLDYGVSYEDEKDWRFATFKNTESAALPQASQSCFFLFSHAEPCDLIKRARHDSSIVLCPYSYKVRPLFDKLRLTPKDWVIVGTSLYLASSSPFTHFSHEHLCNFHFAHFSIIISCVCSRRVLCSIQKSQSLCVASWAAMLSQHRGFLTIFHPRKTEHVWWGGRHAMLIDLQGLSVPMPKWSMFHGREIVDANGETGRKNPGKPVLSTKSSTNGWFCTSKC